jgi:hypothetical protein
VSEPTAPRGPRPAEEVFAERVAPLLELVERWRARVGTEAEIAEELLRAHGHLVAAEERVRGAAALRRRMLGRPDGEPGP